MALLSKHDITTSLARLGALAQTSGDNVELLLVGGSLMVLLFGVRDSTRDVDAVIIQSKNTNAVRGLVKQIAGERGWPEDWLNDGAKGYMAGAIPGPVVFSAPGIVVRRPAIEQLLAMKLCAWRDDVDIADARRLLEMLVDGHDEIWERIRPYLQPGQELKARYAFDDLWEEIHGAN